MQFLNENLKIFKVREDNPVSINYYNADVDLDTVFFFNLNNNLIIFFL